MRAARNSDRSPVRARAVRAKYCLAGLTSLYSTVASAILRVSYSFPSSLCKFFKLGGMENQNLRLKNFVKIQLRQISKLFFENFTGYYERQTLDSCKFLS